SNGFAARIWLMEQAAAAPVPVTSAAGHPLALRRGQLLTTVKSLRQAWHWRRQPLQPFLDFLVRQGFLRLELTDTKREFLLTLLQYDDPEAPYGRIEDGLLIFPRANTALMARW
ncbi:hypothetical protein, partial [Roseomonas sp. BN140053]|uniref:hypothetical protein n=1 Tax=Roseomonas sp. BN140053 TaxID=3391898 RepID=UPI0039E8CE33